MSSGTMDNPGIIRGCLKIQSCFPPNTSYAGLGLDQTGGIGHGLLTLEKLPLQNSFVVDLCV